MYDGMTESEMLEQYNLLENNTKQMEEFIDFKEDKNEDPLGPLTASFYESLSPSHPLKNPDFDKMNRQEKAKLLYEYHEGISTRLEMQARVFGTRAPKPYPISASDSDEEDGYAARVRVTSARKKPSRWSSNATATVTSGSWLSSPEGSLPDEQLTKNLDINVKQEYNMSLLSTVICPICNTEFDRNVIEGHASICGDSNYKNIPSMSDSRMCHFCDKFFLCKADYDAHFDDCTR